MSQRLLATPLALGPNRRPGDQVNDAESFCRHHLDKAFRNWIHVPRTKRVR